MTTGEALNQLADLQEAIFPAMTIALVPNGTPEGNQVWDIVDVVLVSQDYNGSLIATGSTPAEVIVKAINTMEDWL